MTAVIRWWNMLYRPVLLALLVAPAVSTAEYSVCNKTCQYEQRLFRKITEAAKIELKPLRELLKNDGGKLIGDDFQRIADEHRHILRSFQRSRLASRTQEVARLYDTWEQYLGEAAVCYDRSGELRRKWEEFFPQLGGGLAGLAAGVLGTLPFVGYTVSTVKTSLAQIEACNKARASEKNLPEIKDGSYFAKLFP